MRLFLPGLPTGSALLHCSLNVQVQVNKGKQQVNLALFQTEATGFGKTTVHMKTQQ